MKRLSLTCTVLFATVLTIHTHAQNISGKIAYTATVRYSLYMPGTPDKTDTAFLYFNDTSSAYLLDVPRNVDKKKISALIGDIDPDLKEQLIAQVVGVYDKLKVSFDYHRNSTTTISRRWLHPLGDAYCMIDTIPDFNWELSPDTMRILGFLCQKASCKISMGGDIRKFTAWYTPDIPASYGPSKFFGLPGLILMVDNTYFNYTAVAIRIPIQTDELTKLSPCKGLPTITKKQADEIGSKSRADMMNMQKLKAN